MICLGHNGGRRVALRLASAGGPCGARTRRVIMPHRATEHMPAPPVAAAMHAGLSIPVRTHMTDLDGTVKALAQQVQVQRRHSDTLEVRRILLGTLFG